MINAKLRFFASQIILKLPIVYRGLKQSRTRLPHFLRARGRLGMGEEGVDCPNEVASVTIPFVKEIFAKSAMDKPFSRLPQQFGRGHG